jgi:hypothetical protein
MEGNDRFAFSMKSQEWDETLPKQFRPVEVIGGILDTRYNLTGATERIKIKFLY